jgi:orotidine-5'-phosphate decarboxylase
VARTGVGSGGDAERSAADRIIVALDVPKVVDAVALVERLRGSVDFFKVGLQLLLAPGNEAFVRSLVQSGRQVFLDYKFHDIPETVKQAVARAADLGVGLLTVHATPQVMKAAVEGRGGSEYPRILAVTVLTSLSANDLKAMGHLQSPAELVEMRAAQALDAGCDGVVASGHEALSVRRLAAGKPFLIVTPGIRPASAALNDQQRVMTPAQAIANGADYLVIGRPITNAPDPASAAQAIASEIEAALRT